MTAVQVFMIVVVWVTIWVTALLFFLRVRKTVKQASKIGKEEVKVK